MTKSSFYEDSPARARRTTPRPLWVDVLGGFSAALDPIPMPASPAWHQAASDAFEANFGTLSCSRNRVVSRLAREDALFGIYEVPVEVYEVSDTIACGEAEDTILYGETGKEAQQTV